MQSLMKFRFLSIFVLLLLVQNSFAQVLQNIDPFDEIHMTGNVEVILIADNVEEVEIKDGNEDENLTVDVRNGALKIKRIKIHKSKTYESEPIRIEVKYKKIRKIKALAGAQVSNKEVLTGDKIVFRLGSGAIGEFEVDLSSIEMEVSEGAQLEIEGKVESQDSESTTGAVLKAFDLNCDRTYVKANLGGVAKVRSAKLIEASATLGGEVIYKGDPSKIKIKDSLGGSVTER